MVLFTLTRLLLRCISHQFCFCSNLLQLIYFHLIHTGFLKVTLRIWHLSLSNEMEAVPRISMLEVKTKHSPDNSDFVLKLKKLIQVHRKLTIIIIIYVVSFAIHMYLSMHFACMYFNIDDFVPVCTVWCLKEFKKKYSLINYLLIHYDFLFNIESFYKA